MASRKKTEPALYITLGEAVREAQALADASGYSLMVKLSAGYYAVHDPACPYSPAQIVCDITPAPGSPEVTAAGYNLVADRLGHARIG